MSEFDQQPGVGAAIDASRRGLWPKRWRWRISLALFLLLAVMFVALWFSRERIAGDVIDDLLRDNGLSGTYDIVAIDPNRQVIANLVIGDPDHPDFTAERMVVNIDYGLRAPTLKGIELVGARAYGVWRDGRVSFGTLDSLIYTDSDEPAALPAIDLAVRDGRALIESEYGDIGVSLDGEGRLDRDFAGTIAATAPGFGSDECRAETATAYGAITTSGGVPRFDGPLRLRELDCNGARLARADIGADLSLTDDFAGASGDLALSAGRLAYGDMSAGTLGGAIGFSWSDSGLNLRHDLTAQQVDTNYGLVAHLTADGSLRAEADFAQSDWRVALAGEGVRIAPDLRRTLADAREGAEGTLAAPLLAKLNRNLAAALAGGSFAAEATLRTSKDGMALAVPQAQLTGARGETLLAISRASWSDGPSGRLVGNFVTGGEGLPRITGRMERASGGGVMLRAAMAQYSADDSRIAIPRLQIVQQRGGGYAITGIATASGALPGGRVTDLRLPIEGIWSARSGLALGRRCSEVRFGSLSLSQLELSGQALALCPGSSGAMLRYGDTLAVDVTTRNLALNGRLAGSPARLGAASASFSYPQGFVLEGMRAVIGTEGRAVRLTAQTLRGELSGGIGGTFDGGTAMLDLVPLDLSQMAGRWAYRGSELVIEDGNFVLTERVDGVEVPRARFEPLVARDATLTLADGAITALAELRNPGSGRLVTRVDVEHDLSAGAGRARLAVPGLVLDDQLRPQDLTYLALGVVAFADGTISGNGEITWADGEVASTGTFTTGDLDLAAAFGPIEGLRGTIEFTDLIGLTTAPDQEIEIASINPGLEVISGKIRFSLTDGELISLGDARWPFMGGTLILRPVDIRYGEDGPQRYVFEIVGLDAAAFVAQMDLSNFSATGIFDGTVPIEFDDQGNGRIGGGLLISRPPGGNVSYIGELTYEDLGTIANFAFQSLRSLDYRQMAIGLEGSLAGEIVTSFRIDGVTQGTGASSNFLTRRISRLPIRFNINVRSQNFYQLATMVRSFFDPEYLGNPIDRGLLRAEDGRFVRTRPGEAVATDPQNPASDAPDPPPPEAPPGDPEPDKTALRDDEPAIQPSESEDLS